MIQRYLYETLNPDIYHGFNKKPPYFEGWYFKVLSADEQTRYAIIPGIFKGQDGQANESFVQVLDGMTGAATYHSYPVEAFRAHEERFDVWVGDNHFRRDCLSLNIDDEQLTIKGELRLGPGEGWPVRLLEPGVMGWFGWLPFMECYHGIVSFDHTVDGALTVNGERKVFDGGRGYIEKDWGQAFPSAYVWMQTNHFDIPGTSLMTSAALIPSLGRTFTGFLLGFYHQGKLVKMATYTGAKIERLEVTDDHVYYTLADKQHRIALNAERKTGGLLKAPVRTEMHKRVDETMQSTINVTLSHLDGRVIFEGTGRSAALEVHGDIPKLLSYL